MGNDNRLAENRGVFLDLRILDYYEMVKRIGYNRVFSDITGNTEIEITNRIGKGGQYALASCWFDEKADFSRRVVYVRFDPDTGEIVTRFTPANPTPEMENVLYKIVALCTEMKISEG